MARTRTRENANDPTAAFDNDADMLRDLSCEGYQTATELEEFFYSYTLLTNWKPGFLFTIARRLITVSLESGEGWLLG